MNATITVDGLPSSCRYCGHEAEAWPVRVMHLAVIVACPACHSRIAPVLAVSGTGSVGSEGEAV